MGDAVHSQTGASSSSRWMNCSGSVNLIRKHGLKSESNDFADEGTAAHSVLNDCLLERSEAFEKIGSKILVGEKEWVFNAEMADGVQMALDHVYDLMDRLHDLRPDLLPEVRLQHPKETGLYGTSDVVLHVPHTLLHIMDFKYGAYITVEPDESQLIYYAYLAILLLKYEGVVTLTIIQPRAFHPDGPVRSVQMHSDEILEWGEKQLIPALRRTEDDKALLHVGDWCRFCPANTSGMCPALNKTVTDIDTSVDTAGITDAALAEMLTKAPVIRKFLSNIEAEAFSRAKRGIKIEGYKLAKRRADRIFRGEAESELVEVYGEDAYEKKLKTPAAIEKMPGGKDIVSRHAFSPDTGLTLVPVSDKRKAHEPTWESFGFVKMS